MKYTITIEDNEKEGAYYVYQKAMDFLGSATDCSPQVVIPLLVLDNTKPKHWKSMIKAFRENWDMTPGMIDLLVEHGYMDAGE